MDKFDMTEIAGLLHVHEKAVQHGGALNHIANEALLRLRGINEDLNPHKPSTHVPTAFDKEVPPRNVVPEREAPKVIERVPDGELKEPTVVDEPILEEPIVETPVVGRRDL